MLPTKSIFFLLAMLTLLTHATAQTVNYTPTSEVFSNPERGLQKYSITGSNYATTIGANNLSVDTLNGWKSSADRVTVVFRYFLLEDFLASDINATYLGNIQTDFANIRSAGFKTIIRFSYSNAQGSGVQQASKAQILRHIDQLGPLLQANSDVILSHQAGFIGTWGEWYYTNSTEFGDEGSISPTQWANRKEVVDAMLAATPADIPLQVRYVGIKTTLYGTTPLTSATAYQNTATARIGFFNDAFLNNWGDQGTYGVGAECINPVGTAAYSYLSNETQYLPMSGETNGINPCNGGSRTTGANAINELGITNWSTLNRDYHPAFWGQLSTAQYQEILRNLGYRFVLNSSTLSSNGDSFELSLSMSNVGFAQVFKQRPVYLVMKNTADNSISTYLLNSDVRTWESAVSINQNIAPGLTGTFKLYLWMPDQSPALRGVSDYSIRFANTGTWEASTGYNDLLQTIVLDAALPVELSQFSARHVAPSVAMQWQTTSERNSDLFVIERSSDATRWAAIGSVKGAGDSQEVKKYAFWDHYPLAGLQYYRLRQIDTDGNAQLSGIVAVPIAEDNELVLHVYPNPCADWFEVSLPVAETGSPQRLFVLDQKGSIVRSLAPAAQHPFRVDVSGLATGVYTVAVQAGERVLWARLVKQ